MVPLPWSWQLRWHMEQVISHSADEVSPAQVAHTHSVCVCVSISIPYRRCECECRRGSNKFLLLHEICLHSRENKSEKYYVSLILRITKRKPNQFNGISCIFLRFSNGISCIFLRFSNPHYSWFLCLIFSRFDWFIKLEITFAPPPLQLSLHFRLTNTFVTFFVMHSPPPAVSAVFLICRNWSVSNCKLLIDSPHKKVPEEAEASWLKPNYAAKRGNFKCVLNIYDFVSEQAKTRPQVWKVLRERKKKKRDAKILSTKLCCLAQQRKAARKQEENEAKKES